MRRRRSLNTIVVGRNSLRKDGLTQFLRSADFGMVTSVTSVDDCCASRIQQRQLLALIVHTGEDFEAAVEQMESLRRRHPDARVVMIADRYRLNEVAAAFRAGANGYFVDVTSRDVFIKSIELVIMGETVFPPAFLRFALDPKGEHDDHASTRGDQNGVTISPDEQIAPQLSPREKSILRCLVQGDSNKHIARKIDIAEGTVKVHVKAILRKIGVHNRTQAAIWGMSNRSLAGRTQKKFLNSGSDAGNAVHRQAPARNRMDNLLSFGVEKRGDEETKRDDSGQDNDGALVLRADDILGKDVDTAPDQPLTPVPHAGSGRFRGSC